jgi:hypothetical protein
MSDEQVDQSRVRKTATFTTKQVAGAGSVVAALLAIQPLTQMFMTNDKADTMRVQIDTLRGAQTEIKASIAASHAELLAQLKWGNDLILQSIKDSEGRNIHNQDKIEKRLDHTEIKMDRLEALFNNTKTRR